MYREFHWERGDCNFISSFERIVSKSGLRSYVDEQRVVRKKCCISSRSAGLVGGRRRAVYPCKYHRSDIWDDLHLLYFPFFFFSFFLPAFPPHAETSIRGQVIVRSTVVEEDDYSTR